jgi:hypothetical protein
MALTGVAGLALILLAGCSMETWERWDRSLRKAPQYHEVPLGKRFNTRSKASQIRDEKIRNWMGQWFDLRDEYQKLWVKHGPRDEVVIRVETRLSNWKVTIEDRALQLDGQGKPLI